ncbi:MAG: hypothetical protein FD189_1808 [Elusimicrobia bacterium]|nr:MAG: hypothetical protein FD154_1951 [Elusimicrobiota bacterium]KAF0154556.1 MAG: hypothetical protein FD189_1808 [Elusimicrobiota bacterium]
MSKGLQPASPAQRKRHEEVIEPEVVYDGFARREKPSPDGGGFLTRMRFLASGALIIAGMVLLVPGVLLSASLIGALIGVPLMLAGGALLFAGISIGAGKFNVKTFHKR